MLFPISQNKINVPFALIHLDVWDLSPVAIVYGIQWFVTFVNDCTRKTWLYMMKNTNKYLMYWEHFIL